MYREHPDIRLLQIKNRQAEMAAEASAGRSATRVRPRRAYRVSGLKLQVGDLLIVVGRSLCDDDARALRPAH